MAAVDQEMPDIIISDIRMPGLDGLAAALNIHAKHPKVPFIFVSVQDDPAVIRKALLNGARGYVIKSDAGDELASAVEAVLGGGHYLSFSARGALRSRTV
jgi:DNA-binding NarL/FixJ family response regulator